MMKEALEKKTDEELRIIRGTLHAVIHEISAELDRRRRKRERERKVEREM
jgi:hypothetical protein